MGSDHIFVELKKDVSPSRYQHILGVIKIAERLAKRHGVNVERAGLAAALHDCGKFETFSAQRCALRRYRVSLDPIERATPSLWHARLGEELAKRRYGVTDRAVLRAIRVHTTADTKMTPLDMVLFLADALEPGRRYPGVDRLRKIALRSLKDAFRETLKMKMVNLLTKYRLIHPRAWSAWNWINK